MQVARCGPVVFLSLGILASIATTVGIAEERTTALPELEEPAELIEAGDYAGAEILARELLRSVETEHGSDSLEVARVLETLVEALWRGGKVQADETLALAERAVRIVEESEGPDSVELSGSLNELGNVLQARGEYEKAIEAFERGMAIDEKHLGPEHDNIATKLLNIGNAHYSLGNYDAATDCYEQSMAMMEITKGTDSADLAFPLNGLGLVQKKLGDLEKARGFFERAASIQEAALGPDDPRLASMIVNIASTHAGQGDLDTAGPLYERALRIAEQAYGPDHPEVAGPLIGLANVDLRAGRFQESWKLYERALAIRESAFGADHPRVAGALVSMGWIAVRLGKLDDAESMLERAVAIQEKSLGPEHPSLSGSLINLAIVSDMKGKVTRAIGLYERCLAVAEKTYGPDHPVVGQTLANLALTVRNAGDLIRARQLLLRALAIIDRPGADPEKLVGTLNLLGALQTNTGMHEEAKRYFGRAVQVFEEANGPDHPILAHYVNRLSWAHEAVGDVTAAMELLRRALAICEKADGPGAYCATMHLEDMGRVMLNAGDLIEAKAHLERAAQIYGPDEVQPAFFMSLASLRRAEGRLAEARELYDRVLAWERDRYAAGDFHISGTLDGMATLLIAIGDLDAAFEAALEAERGGRDYLRTNAPGLSEQEALGLSSRRSKGLDALASVAMLDPTSERKTAALDSLIRSRALVLDEMAERRRVNSIVGEGPEVARAGEHYAEVSERLAYLTIRGPGADPDKHGQLLEDLRLEREDAERALGELSIRFRSELSLRQVGFQEVVNAVPQGAALVAYIRYDQHSPHLDVEGRQLPGAPPDPQPTFAAFVLREGQSAPEMVRIGEAATVDALVMRWGQEAAYGATAAGWSPEQAELAYRKAGAALRETIWDPVTPLVEGASTVFVVPDGTLHRVDLATLPVDDRQYLVEAGPLVHYLSASRDLLSTDGFAERNEGLLALGAPAFDERPTLVARTSDDGEESGLLAKIAAMNPFRGMRSGCGDFRSLTFEALPASGEEVRRIAGLWEERVQEDDGSVVLTGSRASEAAFKAEAPRKKVVHLATHGFFMDGQCPSAAGRRSAGSPETHPSGENPLLLSGLALAGANERAAAGEGEEDGILTAEEVAALDLTGVEWAVLSACDTGAGEVKTGEGIFGLRRAFRVAGVGTLIVSQWPVEDQAVRDWMALLYRNRFAEGMSTSAAMRATNAEMLRRRRAEKLSTHPFYWAGFVATGDWR